MIKTKAGKDKKLKTISFKKKSPREDSKRKGGSIRWRLMFLPIVLVLIVNITIGFASSYFTKNSLIEEMQRNGEILMIEFLNRLGDNEKGLDAIKKNIEDDIRAAAKATYRIRNEISNDRMKELAADLQVDQIVFYNP